MEERLTRDELERLLARRDDEDRVTAQKAVKIAETLQERYDELSLPSSFQPGMLAVWKDGLKNRRKPLYGEPVIVVEVFAEPILSPQDETGSPYFREPLDTVAALLDPDGDFLLFHFDSRRLRPLRRSADEM